MLIPIAGARVPPAVAKRIELLHITDRERRLFGDERAQGQLESAMDDRIERSGWQAYALGRAACRNENLRRVATHRDDRGG